MRTDAGEALARTALLVRQGIIPSASEEEIVELLTQRRVRIRADARNLAAAAGQTSLIATALLVAELGARVDVRCPEAALRGAQPPLAPADALPGALVDVLDDLITPPGPVDAPDMTVLIGDTAVGVADGSFVVRVWGGAWHAELHDAWSPGTRWLGDSPFGPVLGGIAVAGEVFRLSMRDLAERHPANGRHDLYAGPAVTLRLPSLALVRPAFGELDLISAGAITNAALFTLFRVAGSTANARIFDRDGGALSNLNRYLLLRRCLLGRPKVRVLAEVAPAGWAIDPVAQLYDDAAAAEVALAPQVLVGADNIRARWRVQSYAPGWVCVAGTIGTDVVISEHVQSTACAGCVHPEDDPAEGDLATVSFVSALAGVLQAYRLVRRAAGAERLEPMLAYGFSLPSALAMIGLPDAPNPACPVGCAASRRIAA
jgi:hypothetical protein